ncbi:MAG TPA: acyltransferase [Acetobacteraceae bacterium]|nr:acyltransferase [Acetobacteraceae bacterium]
MRRLVCLDGLRGVLACYVMLSHTLPFAPLPAWLHWLFQHGGAGVDVFFILSGLVIVQSLASFSYQPLPFLIARVARIYPVFLVVFVFAVAVQPLATGFERMAWIAPDSPARDIWSSGWPSAWGIFIATHLTMTHGMFPNGVLPDVWVGFLGAAWSLSTEWQFYLLALLFGSFLGLRRMAWLFLAMSAAAVVWQAAVPDTWQFSRAFLPNKAQYFALGVVSAIVVREGRTGWRAYLVVLAATLALCAVQGGIDKLLPPVVWTACLAAQVLPSSPRQRGPGLWVPAVAGMTAVVLQSRPLVWLGAVSYCIYLVNEPVQKLLGVTLAMLAQGDAALFTALWIPGAIALPILASWWLHTWVEVPAQRYGRGVALTTVSAE